MIQNNLVFKVFLLLIFLSLKANSQTTQNFNEGLAIGQCHQYGREGLYTDQFVYRFFSPGYKIPKPGQVLFINDKGQDVSWKEIKADTAGRFTGRDAANGYIYLTYNSTKEQGAILNISGNSMFYLNGEPHGGDIYNSKWMHTPVKLKKGLNELYIRTSRNMFQGVLAKLIFTESPVSINIEDATLPNVVPGQKNDSLIGAVVIINSSTQPLKGLKIRSRLKGEELIMDVPSILAWSTRKVAFKFNASEINEKDTFNCDIDLSSKGKIIAKATVKISSVNSTECYSNTFISNIDGSVQYYAVNPQSKNENKPSALFLSVHGAGVEAIGQARAYKPKDWGNLVAPTNRRPRGFNWEDWGRIDAMEVLDMAMKQFKPDTARIYLTGHSMGGHGTWYLGATYPGKWAAIAPCAGYPSLMGYGSADGKIPQPGENINEKEMYRASNGSNVFELAKNYNASGIYIHHGDSDKVVSVDYARQMRQVLSQFHKDFSYYEYPGGSHWWSSESVDWPPLFEYFRWHTIAHDSTINKIDFSTANPAVSSTYYWASILQQQKPLQYSRIRLIRSTSKNSFSGETENVSVLKIRIPAYMDGDSISITLDGEVFKFRNTASNPFIYMHRKDRWIVASEPDIKQKGTLRNGTFKEPFNNKMIFVYGTTGTNQENEWSLAKAYFDAETWYYRGNGAVDIIADKEFNPANFPDRGVIIYGNATTNSAWTKVLTDCPIQVKRGSIQFGKEQISGDNYGAYIMYPRKDSRIASVAAITGTGIPGMHAADANQYFSGGSGFPDYMIFSTDMVRDGVKGIQHAGFYNNNWQLGE